MPTDVIRNPTALLLHEISLVLTIPFELMDAEVLGLLVKDATAMVQRLRVVTAWDSVQLIAQDQDPMKLESFVEHWSLWHTNYLNLNLKENVMAKTEVGARVGALLSMTAVSANVLGYGTYDGDHPPPGYEGTEVKNPKITLDNGSVVWGMECWWGPEAAIRKKLDGMSVRFVSVDGEPLATTPEGWK
jgi:hypothetical protein